MSEIVRYDVDVHHIKDPNGGFVRYSDHVIEVAKLKQIIEDMREMNAFGHQCYQDRCEGALVEVSLVKKLGAAVKKLNEEIADLKWHWERATRFVDPGTYDTSDSIVKHLAAQNRVIKKLKAMIPHYEGCTTVDAYDDEEAECSCGMPKEIEAIERGE